MLDGQVMQRYLNVFVICLRLTVFVNCLLLIVMFCLWWVHFQMCVLYCISHIRDKDILSERIISVSEQTKCLTNVRIFSIAYSK